MDERYKVAVLAAYKQKKITGALSSNLGFPTRARIKDECEMIYEERKPLSTVDREILRTFFEPRVATDDYKQLIKGYDTDKFRPLDNFLKERISDPSARNVELLAWLIDYPLRPYAVWFGQINKNPPPLPPVPPGMPRWKIFMWSLITIAMFTSGFLVWKSSIQNPNPVKSYLITGKEKCMYWADDRYHPISCDTNLADRPIVTLDKERLIKLRKITRPDTLTSADIGKVWYGKMNGAVSFYTFGGEHPLDTSKRLLPLTQYMLNKYVLTKTIAFNGNFWMLLSGSGSAGLAIILLVLARRKSGIRKIQPA